TDVPASNLEEAAMTRREFIDAALALIVTPQIASAAGKRTAHDVSHRKLGRTGAEVSCIGVGGYHIGHQQDPAESIRIIRQAIDAARRAGKASFLGFTGHKSSRIHLKMLDTAQANGFRFDTVQMPLNVMDAHLDSLERQVLPRLVREGIGALAMKPMGDPFILDTGTVSARECLRYDLSLPVSVVITGIDSLERLDQALSVARESKVLSEKEVAAVLLRTAEAAKTGSVEKYKTSHHFDGTVQHPEWLGPRAG